MGANRKYLDHTVDLKRQDNGNLILTSGYRLEPSATNTGEWLHHWAKEAPSRVFIAERSGAGWRSETYFATLEKIRAIAASLIARGLDETTPILILSGNGVDHGLLSLAAQYAGIATVPVAEQYSLIPQARGRLVHAVELIKPAMLFADDGEKYEDAFSLDALVDIPVVASRPGLTRAIAFADLLKGDTSVDLDARHALVGPDSVAKILMTSGSTSLPKGVLTTQRMMCVNQTQIATALPFLKERPPVIVDWLPWNHVFGGSHNFNMMLANGGSFYVDEGKPVKGLFDKTIENLQLVTGSLAFNVPVGFGMLLKSLEHDDRLAQRFFENLDMLFYAGASLPQYIWKGMERLAMKITGSVPLLTSSWGLTETAPACTLQYQPPESSGVIGVPLPGVSVKLIPDPNPTDEKQRYEIRVKGPNIFTQYFKDLKKSAEAFDDEDFFLTGDAVKFVDPNEPARGLRFDGRISEDFKLTSGTWVRAGQLRLDLLAILAPLAADLVLTGQDRDKIGLMIFPNRDAITAAGFEISEAEGMVSDEALQAEIARRLADFSGRNSGSSSRIAFAVILSDPASFAEGEITAKGNLNFRTILDKRASIVEKLYTRDFNSKISIG